MKTYRILCIDDEKNILKALGLYLRDKRLEVQLAPTAEEALRMFTLAPPDLVILDVAMPGTNGYETLAAMRTIRYVPSIILSGHATLRDAISSHAGAPDSFMQKPIRRAELLKTVWYLLGEEVAA